MDLAMSAPSDVDLEPYLHKLLENCQGTYVAMIVTDDGYVVSQVLKREVRVKTLAAMTSSLLGLSESVSSESLIGSCGNVMIEGDEGTFVSMRIDDDQILSVAAGNATKIGMLLSAARNCIESISGS